MFSEQQKAGLKRGPKRGHIFKPFEHRFWEKVLPELNSGCWIWTGGHNGQGYGKMGVGRKQAYAHRLAYERYVGPIPVGLHLDHKCRTPWCVNPDHLEPVTNQENSLRGKLSRLRPQRFTCFRGHDLTLTRYVDSQGHNQCRECLHIRQSAYRQRKGQQNAVHS